MELNVIDLDCKQLLAFWLIFQTQPIKLDRFLIQVGHKVALWIELPQLLPVSSNGLGRFARQMREHHHID